MNKNFLILKHFDHTKELNIQNSFYKKSITEFFKWLLENDHIDNDITTLLTVGKNSKKTTNARIIAKSDIVISGIEEIVFLLSHFSSLKITEYVKDGERVKKGQHILKISGNFQEILLYERSILNIMQRMSGIATETARYVLAVDTLNLKNPPYILATRKTPLMVFDKKAVSGGGGLTHRLNLSDGILVKDNHLLVLTEQFGLKTESEMVQKAIEIIFKENKQEFAEIEIEEDESLLASIKMFMSLKTNSVLAILLDNFTPHRARKCIEEINKKYNLENILFEASGGVTYENIPEWAKSGVDVISVGALTHSVISADLSLEILV